ncbi:hypothetical protein LINPERPRIM_LOCUS37506 [Linum perenne]
MLTFPSRCRRRGSSSAMSLLSRSRVRRLLLLQPPSRKQAVTAVTLLSTAAIPNPLPAAPSPPKSRGLPPMLLVSSLRRHQKPDLPPSVISSPNRHQTVAAVITWKTE